MRIIDTFIAYDEVDMIKCRMAELADWDAIHIAVECNATHQGHPKPYFIGPANVPGLLVYQFEVPEELMYRQQWQNAGWYSQVDGHWGQSGDESVIEFPHRTATYDAILELVGEPDDDDLIMVSDTDEIIRGDSMPEILELTKTGPCHIAQRLHRYSAYWFEGAWGSAFAFRWKDRADLNDLRFHKQQQIPIAWGPDPENSIYAGWHLSIWGRTPEEAEKRFIQKITTFVHGGFQVPHQPQYVDPATIQDRVEKGINIHGVQAQPWDGSDMPKDLPT